MDAAINIASMTGTTIGGTNQEATDREAIYAPRRAERALMLPGYGNSAIYVAAR